MENASKLLAEAFEMLEVHNITTWPWWFFLLYTSVLCAGVELLSYIVINGFTFANRIAIKGKHQDVLETIDLMFISWNRFTMLPFMYHAIQLVYYSENIRKLPAEATLQNTLGALVLFYFVYDFFYHVRTSPTTLALLSSLLLYLSLHYITCNLADILSLLPCSNSTKLFT